MALSKAEQRAIVKRDAERRLERDIAEHIALQSPKVADNGMPIDYLPNNHRDVRASRKWNPTRVVGIAPGTEDISDGTPTVLVRRPGQPDEIRTVSSFRQPRRTRRTVSQSTVQATRQTPLQSSSLPAHDWLASE